MPASGLTKKPKPPPAALAIFLAVASVALIGHPQARGEPDTPGAPSHNHITISGDIAHQWQDGGETVVLLRGRCVIATGDVKLSAQKMVLWHKTDGTAHSRTDTLDVFLEGDVRLDRPGQSSNTAATFLTLRTHDGVSYDVHHRLEVEPATDDVLYQRGLSSRQVENHRTVRQAQHVLGEEDADVSQLDSFALPPQTSEMTRVRIFPRDAVPFTVIAKQSTATTPPEQVWILSGGIRLLIEGLDIEGLDINGMENIEMVDLAADHMVIWTESLGENGFSPDRGETVQSRNTPFTVYLEGNVVIRQGQNVLRATRATYEARERRGLYHDVELRTYIPQLQGDLRIRAERLKQRAKGSFHAQRAWVTGSKFGVPGYRLRATDIFLEERYTQPWIGVGNVPIDPETGAPKIEKTPWVTTYNNTFLIEEVPVLYTPYLSGPAENPNVPLRQLTVGYDRIFGGQLKTEWDLFQLTGLEQPDGVTWGLTADEFTARGPAVGTFGKYQGTNLFGFDGPYKGEGQLFYALDDGEDNLGADRRALDPESNDRYRALLRHRHELPNELFITGELGILSDRNFLEQYFEREFDREKDNETLLYATQNIDNWAWSLLLRGAPNDFDATTEWLPKADLFSLSEPLLGGWLTWSSHSSAGYANLRSGDPPSDPTDTFSPLPFVGDFNGAVLMTRHELDMPLHLGPVNVVPYAMGEAAYWGEDMTGDELDRFLFNAGVESSLMMWRVYPYAQSRIFNVNGLAHKILFEANYAFTDATAPLTAIPQYNEFDDNSQERFRERFLTNTFGGVLPAQFDPRFYAVRTGAGRTVTSPYHELVDDQQVLSFAVRQRLQTKEGPLDRQRIKDWMILDMEASYFPNARRDNFNEDLGLIGGRYRWNVGARTSILASMQFDLFDNAQELWNIGVLSQRNERGSVYLGIRQVKGAGLDSQILTASYAYQMSPKWISTFGTAYDLAEARNAGQSLTITRVGADFLVHVGANFDQSKNNAGIAIAIEPRFGALRSSKTNVGAFAGSPLQP